MNKHDASIHRLELEGGVTLECEEHGEGVDLMRELRPDQIFVAGDLADPHGTHRMCAQAILSALPILKSEEITTDVWLYRGAWQEYQPYEIDRDARSSDASVPAACGLAK